MEAVLDGSLAKGSFRTEPFFGLSVLEALAGVPAELLDPRGAWADGAAYDRAAWQLMARFEENFAQFHASADAAVQAAEIHAAA
jgi:phosphoenolpyruvate carboxykinase (ATP)